MQRGPNAIGNAVSSPENFVDRELQIAASSSKKRGQLFVRAHNEALPATAKLIFATG